MAAKSPVSRKMKLSSGLLISGITLIAICTIFKMCSHPPTYAFPPEKEHSGGDTLDIAIEVSPMLYSLSDDTVSGLDYELACAMSASWDRPIKFHPFAQLTDALSLLVQGRYDIVVGSLPSSMEMKENFNMTAPLYIDRQILVQHLSHPDSLPSIRVQTQLAGDTVWITSSSPFATRIQNLANEIGDTIYIERAGLYSSEQLFILVALGDIPRAVLSETVAKKMKPDYPLADISTPVSFSQFQSWALNKKDTSLSDSVNTWINEFKTTDRYRNLCKKYLD